MTDTMRTGSTRALKPAAINHFRRNRAFVAIGATCVLAGVAAVGVVQPSTSSAAEVEQVAPSLAEITQAQAQNFDANLLTGVNGGSFERDESVSAELEPEPEPEPTQEEAPAGNDGDNDESQGDANYPDSKTYTGGSPQAIAQQMLNERGQGDQFGCYDAIITQESGWDPYATNPSSGAYGLAQAYPGNKMATHGSDWQTNPATQIAWSLDYMDQRYGGPCGAYDFKFTQGNGWY